MMALELDFAVERGAFALALEARVELEAITAVFGPSGAGKTTLLRAIAGLERPTRGRIACGRDVWDDETRHVPAHERRVGYVFQDARLFPHLNVEQNLRFASRHARSAGPIVFDDAVAALDLHALLGRRPASLSGGEQQRAAIARALLTNPRLLLMDEPLSSLDAARRRDVAAYVERLPGELGVPILYITHDIDEVVRLASSMLLLSRGALAAHGTVEDVLARIDLWPLTGRLEAGSLLHAVVTEHGGGMTTLAVGDQRLRIPAIQSAIGRTITLRVHARDVAVASERPANISIRNVLAGRLSRIDLDETVYAELLVDVGAQSLRARITREALDELHLYPGCTLYALVKSVAFDDSLLR